MSSARASGRTQRATSGSAAETETAETRFVEANTTTVLAPVLAQERALARSGRSASGGAGSGLHFAGKDQTQNREQERERVRKSHLRLHPILVQLAFDVHPHAHARRTFPASACAPRPPSGAAAPPSSARARPPSLCCSRATALVIVLARETPGLDRDRDLSAVATAMRRRASLCVSPSLLPPPLLLCVHFRLDLDLCLDPYTHHHTHLDPRDWTRTADPQAQVGRRSSSGSRWPCSREVRGRFGPYGSYGSWARAPAPRTYSSPPPLLDQTRSSASAMDAQKRTCSASSSSSLRTTVRAGG